MSAGATNASAATQDSVRVPGRITSTPEQLMRQKMIPAPIRYDLTAPISFCGKQNLNFLLGIGTEDSCPVCGDEVSGYHYGLQTCESCKGFFKRTVQNKKMYTCVDSNSCIINKPMRKNCPSCRFRKCLDVGMKVEAVRENRVRGGRNKFGPMYKYHRALRTQAERYRQQVLVQIGAAFLQSPYSADLIHQICRKDSPPVVPYSVHQRCPSSSPSSWRPMPFACDRRTVVPDPLPDAVGLRRQNYHYFVESSPRRIGSERERFDERRTEDLGGQKADRSSEFSADRSSAFSADRSTVISVPGLRIQHLIQGGCDANSPNDFRTTSRMTGLSSPSGGEFCRLGPSYFHPRPADGSGADKDPGFRYENTEFETSSRRSETMKMMTKKKRLERPREGGALDGSTPDSKSGEIPLKSLETSIADRMLGSRDYETLGERFRADADVIADEFRDIFVGWNGSPRTLSGSDVITDPNEVRRLLQLLCRMTDQILFLTVEWTRNAHLFKDLKTDHQMRLLENCWSELLVMDLLFLQTRHNRTDHLLTMSGHWVPLDMFQVIGIGDLKKSFREIVRKLKSLKVHQDEVTCLKFIVLLNPDIGGDHDHCLVEENQETVSGLLMDYCNAISSSRFGQLLMQLPEIQALSLKFEDHLYRQCLQGTVPENSVLSDMLKSSQR